MNDGQSRPRQENNMTNLNRDLLNFHPSERAAMRKLQEQKANEPQIILGKFWGTFAVQFVDGKTVQCHNIATARQVIRRHTELMNDVGTLVEQNEAKQSTQREVFITWK
tara:strand:+ start:178 stop:504 length:327 start_codon:yes stop_codon:yes gene_type:complete